MSYIVQFSWDRKFWLLCIWLCPFIIGDVLSFLDGNVVGHKLTQCVLNHKVIIAGQ